MDDSMVQPNLGVCVSLLLIVSFFAGSRIASFQHGVDQLIVGMLIELVRSQKLRRSFHKMDKGCGRIMILKTANLKKISQREISTTPEDLTHTGFILQDTAQL